MNDLNKVILVGRLGKDPDISVLGSGRKRAAFSMATNRSYKNNEGSWIERTDWHQMVAWGAIAENCEQKLKKGDPILIEGRIQNTVWKDQENKERKSTQVVVDRLRTLSVKAPKANEGWEGVVESKAVLGI